MSSFEHQVRQLLAKANDDLKSELRGSTATRQASVRERLADQEFWSFSRLTGIFSLLVFGGQFSYDVAKAWATLEGVIPSYVRWVDAVGVAYDGQQLIALMIFTLIAGSALAGFVRWLMP